MQFQTPFTESILLEKFSLYFIFSQGRIFSNSLAVCLTFLLVSLTIASICFCISCTLLNNTHWNILWFISLLCHGSCKWDAFRWWLPQFSVLNFSRNFTSFFIERWLPASTKSPKPHHNSMLLLVADENEGCWRNTYSFWQSSEGSLVLALRK